MDKSEIQDLFIYSRTVPARKAHYAEYPELMLPELCEYLEQQGIKKLYTHQAEMFERASSGENVVITTSTASGKTLSFLLPVIQKILEDPTSRAIFIYPTKALASDQYRAMLPIIKFFGEDKIQAGVYDGDTPVNERSRIRKGANIILTNPDMINGAFLPNHSRYGFDFIFANLKYIVIDELHTYRGIFGSHVSNLFRRLSRITKYYNADPQFLCSSATIANPVELAEGICHRSFSHISQDGSPAAQRTYVLVQPPRITDHNDEYFSQIQATTIAADMIPKLVDEGHSFIAFAKSRRNVEVVLREARDKMKAAGFLGTDDADLVSGYRGGYTPQERKAIEKAMISGKLRGLVSTNALELGIDIGKIDTTVLVGYPGTRASFWQQTGRAGRNGKGCVNYLILESLPFDQYIGVNPKWLFETSSENAIIDMNNIMIELAHIRAAAAELPLSLDDIALFPDLGESIPVLMKVGELKEQRGKFAWCGNAFPAGDFSMRNMDKIRYKLMNQESHTEITEMDELQAYRELHPGAVYMHDGNQYQVLKLDRDSHTAFAIPFKGDYYTMPGSNTEIKIVHQRSDAAFGRTKVYWGDVNVNDMIFMYKKLQFHNHQNLGYEELPEVLSKDYDTEGIWLRIPSDVVNVYRRFLKRDESGRLVKNNHFDGMCHAIKSAAMMVTMTEQEDIGVSMSTNAIGMDDDMDGEVYLFLYDKVVDGLGYAQKAYEKLPQIIEQAIAMVNGCGCKNGCAACVGDYTLEKAVVLWGLESLSQELNAPDNTKYIERPERPVQKKKFVFHELGSKWGEFCEFMASNGDQFAAFLATVPSVRVSDNTITLATNSEFYKNWILKSENKAGLMNIFRFYTDAPEKFKLEIRVEHDDPSKAADLKDKMQRRYNRIHKNDNKE